MIPTTFFLRARRPAKRYVGTGGALLLGLGLLLSAIVIVQNLVAVWPRSAPATIEVVIRDSVPDAGTLTVEGLDSLEERVAAAALDTVRARLRAEPVGFWLLVRIGQPITLSWDFRLLFIALLMGALGSWLHGATSFVRFYGNRQLVSSWVPWYLVRPFLGAFMAVVFYVTVRAGFMANAGSTDGGLGVYGVAAFSALVGLFTEKASKKLSDVFSAMFSPRAEHEDADRLEEGEAAAPPRIESIDPQWIQVGDRPMPVRVEGLNFSDDPRVKVDGSAVEASVETEGRILFELDAALRAAKGSHEVVVENAAGASDPRRITVTP